jgi:hypothetical protein
VIRIEVIGLEPPCVKCTALLENAQAAVGKTGIAASVEKKHVLSAGVLKNYGLLLSPALAVDGVVVTQGKLLTVGEIVQLIGG